MAMFQSLPEVNENMAESYAWLIVILMQIQTCLVYLFIFFKKLYFPVVGFLKSQRSFLYFQ